MKLRSIFSQILVVLIAFSTLSASAMQQALVKAQAVPGAIATYAAEHPRLTKTAKIGSAVAIATPLAIVAFKKASTAYSNYKAAQAAKNQNISDELEVKSAELDAKRALIEVVSALKVALKQDFELLKQIAFNDKESIKWLINSELWELFKNWNNLPQELQDELVILRTKLYDLIKAMELVSQVKASAIEVAKELEIVHCPKSNIKVKPGQKRALQDQFERILEQGNEAIKVAMQHFAKAQVEINFLLDDNLESFTNLEQEYNALTKEQNKSTKTIVKDAVKNLPAQAKNAAVATAQFATNTINNNKKIVAVSGVVAESAISAALLHRYNLDSKIVEGVSKINVAPVVSALSNGASKVASYVPSMQSIKSGLSTAAGYLPTRETASKVYDATKRAIEQHPTAAKVTAGIAATGATVYAANKVKNNFVAGWNTDHKDANPELVIQAKDSNESAASVKDVIKSIPGKAKDAAVATAQSAANFAVKAKDATVNAVENNKKTTAIAGVGLELAGLAALDYKYNLHGKAIEAASKINVAPVTSAIANSASKVASWMPSMQSVKSGLSTAAGYLPTRETASKVYDATKRVIQQHPTAAKVTAGAAVVGAGVYAANKVKNNVVAGWNSVSKQKDANPELVVIK
jgi:hypothetical protein